MPSCSVFGCKNHSSYCKEEKEGEDISKNNSQKSNEKNPKKNDPQKITFHQ